MTYYTIYLGDKPWENVIDDINQHDTWGVGSMFWSDEKKAIDCVEYLKIPVFGFEDENKKFAVVRFEINYNDLR